MRRIAILLMACAALAGCSLPRGAPLKGEILSQSAEKNTGIAVVEITRANLEVIKGWPSTGGQGYHWLQGGGGPLSPVIRPGDSLSLQVWDNDPNSLLLSPTQRATDMPNLTVSPAGEIFVPYAGNVLVNGLTPDRAREVIEAKLTEVAPNAQVLVNYRPGAGNSVDLVRGVQKPHQVLLEGRNVTILAAIAEGGGVANNLRNPLVRLMRGGKTYSIRADDLFADSSKNVVLRPGDKVLVEEDKRFFTTLGATGIERPIYFETERMSAIQATAMTGGLIDGRADPQGILILRDYPASAVRADGVAGPKDAQVIFVMDITSADGIFAARNFEVLPGDTIMATESPTVALNTLLGLIRTGAIAQSRIFP